MLHELMRANAALGEACGRAMQAEGIGESDLPPSPASVSLHRCGGLMGIIKDKAIRATHTDHLNDNSEGRYGRSLAMQVIEGRLMKFIPRILINEYSRHERITPEESWMGRISSNLKKEHWPGVFLLMHTYDHLRIEDWGNFFVASFCQDDNLLSQWGAICGSGGGYSIGIHVSNSFLADGDNRYQLFRMLYRPERQ